MKVIAKIFTVAAIVLCATAQLHAQTGGNDVFVPIAKYITQGNAEALSAWFDDNLEISIISSSINSSRNQAKQIVTRFFSSYSPRSFKIDHTAGRANMKYALGSLSAGGENFLVTIFVCRKEDSFYIQQLKIERIR